MGTKEISAAKNYTFLRLLHFFRESGMESARLHSHFLGRGIAGVSIINEDRKSSRDELDSG